MRILPLGAALVAALFAGIAIWQVLATPQAVLDLKGSAPLPPVAPSPKPVLVTVQEGDSAATIAERLEDQGVIASAFLFRVLVSLQGYEGRLKAGEYELDQGMAVTQVISRMVEGRTKPLVVTIPEGLRAEEIAAVLEEAGVVGAGDFLQALADDYDFDFIAAIPRGQGLEGYLFPDTYYFSRRVTPTEVVRAMLENFDRQFSPALRQEAARLGLSVHQVVTLASIVEREAVVPQERPLIASVFLNRLRRGMRLQADPTVQYALGCGADTNCWKQELTQEDLSVDSPYNTYVYYGLPPGPIASPGLDSLLAVVRPAATDYLYFVAKGDGSHVFAETLAEHLDNVQRYRGQGGP